MGGSVERRAVPAVPDEGRVIPCFQPILALDSRRIAGYEVLARSNMPQGLVSLGPFLTDVRVPIEEQMRVDRRVRELAIGKLAEIDRQRPMLFINLKPSWIQRMYREKGELLTLRLLEKYAIDPARIVLEITEEAYMGSMGELRQIIDVYRRQGCLIAIDDVGTGFNSADRIAQIQPNLIKVDIHMMKRSASHSGYLGVLRSFSTLAEQIGASLLIEGVETYDDLLRAIQIGARYVQGYLFAQAGPEFHPADRFAELIGRGLDDHRRMRREEERFWSGVAERLLRELAAGGFVRETGRVAAACEALPDHADVYDGMIERLLPRLPDGCMRVYLCRQDGVQLSSNYRLVGGLWAKETEYRSANWSWRPYFLSDLLTLQGNSGAAVSRTYADLESRQWIRTVSVTVSDEGILLIDMEDPHGGSSERP